MGLFEAVLDFLHLVWVSFTNSLIKFFHSPFKIGQGYIEFSHSAPERILSLNTIGSEHAVQVIQYFVGPQSEVSCRLAQLSHLSHAEVFVGPANRFYGLCDESLDAQFFEIG